MTVQISGFMLLFVSQSRRERRARMRQMLETRLLKMGYTPVNWEKNSCIVSSQSGRLKVFYSNTYKDLYGVCCYSDSCQVGIDLEAKIRVEQKIEALPYNRTRKLIELSGVSDTGTAYWTMQEAIGKLTGSGLDQFYEFMLMTDKEIQYRYQSGTESVYYQIYNIEQYQFVLVYRPADSCDIKFLSGQIPLPDKKIIYDLHRNIIENNKRSIKERGEEDEGKHDEEGRE